MKEDKSKLEIIVEERDNLQQKLQNMIEREEGADVREYDEESSYISSPQYEMDELARKIEGLNLKIGEIYYEQEKNIYKQEYDKRIVDYSRGRVLSDFTKVEDLFDRREKAKTLAQYIKDKTTNTPFNIGVFARWGEGKTTFLDYLQEELEALNREKNKNNENFKTFIVNYDASEYTEKDKIWASIMRAMFLQYEKDTWFPKFFYIVKKILCNKKKFTTYILSFMSSMVIVCALSAYSINILWHDWNKEWKIITGSGATIIAIVILVTKMLVPTVKVLLQSSVPLSDKIVNNISLPDYVNKLGERENIKKDLSILVDAWLHRWPNDNKRIVLIIDELDRCSEKGIIEFFQSMQLFLKVPQLVIVFAIDQEYLKKSLSNSFGIKEKNEINEFLLEYLDKYINIPISLDTQVNYLNYIDYLLKKVEKNQSNFSISEGEKQAIKSAIDTLPILFLTPRKVKKLVNVMIISKETCVLFNKKNNGTEIIDFRGYIFWFIFSYFYEEDAKKILVNFKYNGKYHKLKYLFNKMSKDNRNRLMEKINNKQIIELIDEIVLKDILNYETVLSGFTKII